MKYVLTLALALAFFGVLCCTESENNPPLIRILEPKSGAKFKVGETARIITESDYDIFAQNLTYDATTDSGKSWLGFIGSLALETGMKVKDTVNWKPSDAGFRAGEKTKIRVWEYGKKYYAYSDWIEIIP